MTLQPNVAVGILANDTVLFSLNESYILGENGYPYKDIQVVEIVDGKILFNGNFYDELHFSPSNSRDKKNLPSFTIYHVMIGISFHWQRSENQTFEGDLHFEIENGKIRVINILPIEKYLMSVISSEMAASNSLSLLKAHAVISRSWVMAQLSHKKTNIRTSHPIKTSQEWCMWYDHENHDHFDVCADDHCQRYQGLLRIQNQLVKKAVQETYGELLTYHNQICDARFSKCCGGISETFENCWQNEPHPYLVPIYDHSSSLNRNKEILPVDLCQENSAEAWIRNKPEAFCNTSDKKILTEVLNNYDQETTDFYRWKISYTQEELKNLIEQHCGFSLGTILDLIPLQRGPSGRIVRLKIVGSRRNLIIGKELEIRKCLSSSHLYSSAFIVEKEYDKDNFPASFKLIGAGWGHGVGLCQIGAAMMSQKGYDYLTILFHYFKHTHISKLY